MYLPLIGLREKANRPLLRVGKLARMIGDARHEYKGAWNNSCAEINAYPARLQSPGSANHPAGARCLSITKIAVEAVQTSGRPWPVRASTKYSLSRSL